MKTKLLQSALVTCACLGFAIPQAEGSAPARLNSITVEFDGTEATYMDDLDPFTVVVTNADLTTGPFRYEKTAQNIGKLDFTNWTEDTETYTGTFTLTFTSATAGTFYKNYSGTYTGYISGTFVILSMDVAGRPVAKGKTVRLEPNQKAKFRLQGKGLDVRNSGLVYKITKKPKVGKLNTSKLPVVVYQPKPGFRGTVKFDYIVKEGKTASKPATVKLVVK
jgi:hypothetical protein